VTETEPITEEKTETQLTFKNPQKFPFFEKDQMLHWVSQINDEKFCVILKKLTTPLTFNVKELWVTEKASRQAQAQAQAQVKKHEDQKEKKDKKKQPKKPPPPKKADLIKAQTTLKLNQKLTDNDAQLITHSIE